MRKLTTNMLVMLAFLASNLAFAGQQDNDPTAEEVIENYLEAIGGKAKLEEIRNAKIEMVTEFQGMVMNMYFIHDEENERMNQRVLVMGNEASNITLKDGKAKVLMMGQTQELTDEQYQEAKMNMSAFPELRYGTNGYELSYEGKETVNDEEAYKIVVKNQNGVSQTNFYSVESGLKLRNENTTSGNTEYLTYDEIDGIMYPVEMRVKSPMVPEAITANVESIEFNTELSEDDFE
ncbi:hypothetical protein KI659_06990 [Litoribacter alkaliphilus]|uniref:Outer membrane lipoprotein-sorting protein n=1 Tax=Litoribacter ruber TaxID=702568 RepID=A0AAP2G4S2_9BACT|nr:hypothetical protein [Litoribacter alkaliphilus]MBS9523763.1 hypothetical protein [Litoribacter alkaliphilus]